MPDQHRIAILVCYFGHWPAWFDFYLKSCQYNPSVDFLIFSDCGEPDNLPGNVRIIDLSLQQFNRLASEKLGLEIDVRYPYKLCDFKPAFGTIFADYLEDFDFWASSDIDLIYGNIRKFLTEELLSEYDVISARKEYLAGHLTLYRNHPHINRLYEESTDYPRVFLEQDMFSFSECSRMWRHLHRGGSIFEPYVYPDKFSIRKHKPAVESMSHVVSRLHLDGRLKAHFETMIKDRPELVARVWQLVWEQGALHDALSGEETLYLHMIGFKDQEKFVIPDWDDIPDRFYVTRNGFSIDGTIYRTVGDRLLENLPLARRISRWKNLPY